MANQTQPHYPVAGEHISESAVFSLLPENLPANEATILFVHAHPDDESSSTGATISALTAAGANVHLITMTRGEMGEVIDPALKHLEAAHRSNTDGGNALGELRTAELSKALKHLGISHHLFLGQGASYLPGELTRYRDSGMAWGADGRATTDPNAAPDSLTRLPLKPQTDSLINAIRYIKPDVIVTYDQDGGYGHPDHKRTHDAVYAAALALEGTSAAPKALWGIEGDPNPQDQRQQAVIRGNLDQKREAMRAHATQITITSPETFEYSNGVSQPINPVETYRLLLGNFDSTGEGGTDEGNLAPGPLNTVITSLALGLISGFAGTMYHAHIWYSGSGLWLPWGAVLAILTVYFASTWAAINSEKNWAAALVGATAFALVGLFAYAKGTSMLVYINPINPIGTAGTIWALGILVASTLGIMTATKHRLKNT